MSPTPRATYRLHPLVRKVRERSGLPLGVVAARIGITHGHLSNLEAGRRGASVQVVRALADALGLTWDEVTNGTEEAA